MPLLSGWPLCWWDSGLLLENGLKNCGCSKSQVKDKFKVFQTNMYILLNFPITLSRNEIGNLEMFYLLSHNFLTIILNELSKKAPTVKNSKQICLAKLQGYLILLTFSKIVVIFIWNEHQNKRIFTGYRNAMEARKQENSVLGWRRDITSDIGVLPAIRWGCLP